MVVHMVMSAVSGALLVRDWIEARRLWDLILTVWSLREAVIMPTHLHATVEEKDVPELKKAARRYALWRNHHRGQQGAVFRRHSEPVHFTDLRHGERTDRYILLNPCREGIADDPLAWPFSTHRDAVGLSWPAWRQPVQDPERFHRRISADPSVHPDGTSLPLIPHPERLAALTIPDLRAAVSAITRTPEPLLRQRGPARSLLVRACVKLSSLSVAQIAGALGLHPATVRRAASAPTDPAVELVARVVGDARFTLLTDGQLPWLPARR